MLVSNNFLPISNVIGYFMGRIPDLIDVDDAGVRSVREYTQEVSSVYLTLPGDR